MSEEKEKQSKLDVIIERLEKLDAKITSILDKIQNIIDELESSEEW